MRKFTLLMVSLLAFTTSILASPNSTSGFKVSSFKETEQPSSKIEKVVQERTNKSGDLKNANLPTRSLVEVPSDLEPVTYYLQSGEYFESTMQGFMNATAYFNTIQVAVQGNDMYIAGLFTYEPDSWIKGTI